MGTCAPPGPGPTGRMRKVVGERGSAGPEAGGGKGEGTSWPLGTLALPGWTHKVLPGVLMSSRADAQNGPQGPLGLEALQDVA